MFRKKIKTIDFLRLAALKILNNQLTIMLALERSLSDKELHEEIIKSAENMGLLRKSLTSSRCRRSEEGEKA